MKKILKMVIIITAVFLLSGCTQVLKGTDKKPVINETTGQSLTENIICQPTDEKVIQLYKDNKVDLESLPDCSKMKLFDKYVSIWNTLFIQPLAWLILKIGVLVRNNGLSVIILGILIRLLLTPLTKQSMNQAENQKKAQPEIKRIEKKYEGKTDKESMLLKSQETMAVYKKHNIKLASGCLTILIQFPLFLAFYEAVNRVPAIFEQSLIGFQLGTTPLTGIKLGQYQYILIPILMLVTTYFSFKMNQNQTAGDENMQKQMKGMSNFFVIFMGIMSLNFATAVAFYWISSSAFTILQNWLIRRKEVK